MASIAFMLIGLVGHLSIRVLTLDAVLQSACVLTALARAVSLRKDPLETEKRGKMPNDDDVSQPSRDEAVAVRQLADDYRRMRAEIGKVIIGQDEVIEQLLIALRPRARPAGGRAGVGQDADDPHDGPICSASTASSSRPT